MGLTINQVAGPDHGDRSTVWGTPTSQGQVEHLSEPVSDSFASKRAHAESAKYRAMTPMDLFGAPEQLTLELELPGEVIDLLRFAHQNRALPLKGSPRWEKAKAGREA